MEAIDLQKLVERYQENKDFIENEETAKMALVVPFIRLLGYDPNIPREVRLEYCAPFIQGDGKKLPDRMDFAIFDKTGQKPLIVIETKPLGTDLKAKSQQLARYIAQLPELHFGIITDGCHFLFFGDLDDPNLMDKEPFFTFSLDDSRTDWAKVAKFLNKFSRDAFNAETLLTDAENARYRQGMIERLIKTLKNPAADDDFLRWLMSGVYQGKRTAGVVARFSELAREAVEPAVLGLIGDEFMERLKERILKVREATPEARVADVKPPNVEPTPPDVPKIETTKEEMDFYALVRSMVSAEGMISAEDILFRDTTNYFNISYKAPRKWFVRLFSGGRRRSVTTPVPLLEARQLAAGFEVEESPTTFGTSRVYFNDAAQLQGLKPLLVRSLQIVQSAKEDS